MAEVLAIKEGLRIAVQQGYQKFEVDFGSKAVLDLIRSRKTNRHPLTTLIGDCLFFTSQPHTCDFSYVLREGNIVADSLAN